MCHPLVTYSGLTVAPISTHCPILSVDVKFGVSTHVLDKVYGQLEL